MKKRRFGSGEGLTIVECLVALMIFGLFIGGLCALLLQSRKASDQARHHYVAVNLAKNRLEKARTFGFSEVDMFEENQVPVNGSGTPDTDGDYRRDTVVSNLSVRLKEIFVSVEIRNRVSRTFDGESETLSSYIADHMERP